MWTDAGTNYVCGICCDIIVCILEKLVSSLFQPCRGKVEPVKSCMQARQEYKSREASTEDAVNPTLRIIPSEMASPIHGVTSDDQGVTQGKQIQMTIREKKFSLFDLPAAAVVSGCPQTVTELSRGRCLSLRKHQLLNTYSNNFLLQDTLACSFQLLNTHASNSQLLDTHASNFQLLDTHTSNSQILDIHALVAARTGMRDAKCARPVPVGRVFAHHLSEEYLTVLQAQGKGHVGGFE